MDQTRGAALGVLQLQNKPTMFKGSVSHPDTFAFPILALAVPGAWVSNVVAGDPAVEDAFVAAAKELVRRGAAAITTNCGFTIRHQRAIACAVPVPVATSTLLMVPLVAAMTAGTVGLITFDARPLTREVLRSAGIGDELRVAVAGVEGTPTWEIMSRPDAPITLGQLERDVLAAIESLRRRVPDLSVLVFECAGFPAVARRVREVTGMPVYDVTTMANLMMSAMWSSAPAASR